MIIGIRANGAYASNVPGVYAILYITAAVLCVLTALLAAFLTHKQVLQRRYKKYLKRLQGTGSDVRPKPAAKAT